VSDLEDGDFFDFDAAVRRHRQRGWVERVELGDILSPEKMEERAWPETRRLLVERLRASGWLTDRGPRDRCLLAVDEIERAESLADAELPWQLLVRQADEDRVWLETYRAVDDVSRKT